MGGGDDDDNVKEEEDDDVEDDDVATTPQLQTKPQPASPQRRANARASP